MVARVTGGDEPHRVAGCPGRGRDTPLGWALPVLRERSPDGVRAVLPAAGDPRGLPGPGPFTTAALGAGEAVLGRGIGLVPRITDHGSVTDRTSCVLWTAYEVAEPAPDPLTVAEAEHDLTAATRDAAAALAALDVASWRPEVADGLAKMRRGVTPDLPPGHDGPRGPAARLGRPAGRGAGPGRGRLPRRRGQRRRGPRPRRRAPSTCDGRPPARLAAYNAVPSRHR